MFTISLLDKAELQELTGEIVVSSKMLLLIFLQNEVKVHPRVGLVDLLQMVSGTSGITVEMERRQLAQVLGERAREIQVTLLAQRLEIISAESVSPEIRIDRRKDTVREVELGGAAIKLALGVSYASLILSTLVQISL